MGTEIDIEQGSRGFDLAKKITCLTLKLYIRDKGDSLTFGPSAQKPDNFEKEMKELTREGGGIYGLEIIVENETFPLFPPPSYIARNVIEFIRSNGNGRKKGDEEIGELNVVYKNKIYAIPFSIRINPEYQLEEVVLDKPFIK